jgi:hypothetical protein
VAVREAFLASLSQNGGVRGSCAAVGMTVASVYQLRKRDSEFESAWDAALERARAARAARQSALVPRNPSLPGHRIRHDGWTEARQKTFLRALAETGCVRDACARAAISNVSAYRLRNAQPDFARAWERALAKAAPTVEQAAFERAVQGWDEVVTRDGREVSRRRRYSDSLLRLLLQRGDPGARRAGASAEAGAETASDPGRPIVSSRRFVGRRIATEEETNAVLIKRLDILEREIRAKQARADAVRHAAQWESWQDGWRKWGTGQARPRPQLLLPAPARP